MGPDGYICQFTRSTKSFWADRDQLALGATFRARISIVPRGMLTEVRKGQHHRHRGCKPQQSCTKHSTYGQVITTMEVQSQSSTEGSWAGSAQGIDS